MIKKGGTRTGPAPWSTQLQTNLLVGFGGFDDVSLPLGEHVVHGGFPDLLELSRMQIWI
jgi:hypothetical protein